MDTFPKVGDTVKLYDLKTHVDLNGVLCNCVKVYPVQKYDIHKPNFVHTKPYIKVRFDFKFKGKDTFKIKPENYRVVELDF